MGKKRRTGFKGGGMDAGTPGGGFGMGVGPDGVGAAPGGKGDTGLGGSGTLGSKSGPVTSKSGVVKTPGALKNALNSIQREQARKTNAAQLAAIEADPNLSLKDYNPATLGGLNPTDGLSFGQSLGYQGAQLGEALGAMSPGAIMGGIMGLAAGIPGLGFLGSMFGQDQDKASVFGTGVPNAGELNDTQEIGDTFSMPAPSGIRGFLSNPFGMNNPNVDPLGMPTPIGTGTDTDSAMRDFNDRVAAQNEANKGFSMADLFGPSNVPPDRGGPDKIILPPTMGTGPTPLPITGYGSIDPNANYQYLFGGRRLANGGLIPPESGPMSSGIGNLFKMK